MSEEFDYIKKINPASPDFKTKLVEQIAELAPELITEGKVEFKKLREVLGDDARESVERFGLFWPGKREAIRMAQAPTTATLKPDQARSKNWETTQNVFIEGDNLEVLKILQSHYYGKIKLIYIDPPYNTGKDFVYNDDFRDGVQNYLKWTAQVNDQGIKISSNSENEGRYHSSWLSMMYPRLKLARNLLQSDGVIFISIDEKEYHHLRCIANEIFGENNFLGTIVWRTATDNNPTNVAVDHEYIVVYARNSSALDNWDAPSSKGALIQDKYMSLKAELGDDIAEIQKRLRKWIKTSIDRGDVELDGVSHYDYVDEKGVYYPGNSSNTRPGGYNYDIIHPITGLPTAKPKKGWRWPFETFKKAADNGEVHWGEDESTVPKIKKRLDSATELLKSSYYEDNRGSSAFVASLLGGSFFENPKSTNLLEHLMKFPTRNNDIVLDFFAGSASTAHAVFQLNLRDQGSRRFILVQLPEPTPFKSKASEAGLQTISDIARERIKRAGQYLEEKFSDAISKREQPLDIGFRCYELCDTSLSKWNADSTVKEDELRQTLLSLEDSASNSATVDDLFTELLIKQGFSLTENIEDIEIEGLKLKVIRPNDQDKNLLAVLAYLDKHNPPNLEQLRAITQAKPTRLVILEDTFQGNDELKTNLVQMCKTNNIELWTA